MGPKPQPQTKKGTKKKAKAIKKLTAARRAYYSFQAKELHKFIGRLRSYSTQLENENEDLRKELEVLDTDRSDVISLLKRRLSDKNEEIKELQERSNALQEVKQAEKKFLKNYIKKKGNEYKLMHEQLTSEIKLLHGKLNSLEEFKLHRDELMKKFAAQEEALEEQERKHKRTLYEVEKKFIISKDKLRKDMEERLLKLSLDFQKATQTRIASTTQSVIRENIAINNELSLLIGSWQKLFDENETLKDKTKQLTNEIDLANDQKKKAMNRNVIQAQVIDRLAFEHKQILESFDEVKQLHYQNAQMLKKVEEWQRAAVCAQQEANQTRKQKEEAEVKLSGLTRHFNKLCNKNHDIEQKLKIALFSIKQAIGLSRQRKTGAIDEATEQLRRDELLQSLVQLFTCDQLISVTSPDLKNASVETIIDNEGFETKGKYAKGDLGIFATKRLTLIPESELSSLT